MLAELVVAATCAVSWSHHLPGPDNAWACTPGSYDRLPAFPRADHPNEPAVCIPKDRPSLPAKVRRDILARYNKPNWSGADGELDHRVPFFLGGHTDRKNIWPEKGRTTNNEKDDLENYIRRRICVRHTMRVRTARRIFLSDWRHAYFYYHLNS